MAMVVAAEETMMPDGYRVDVRDQRNTRSGTPHPVMKPDGYRARVVDTELERGLNAAGFVVLEGPRACGKTWTGLRFARSAVRLDVDVDARVVGSVEPSVLLAGERPRLIDEWQVVPSVWNHVRHVCDSEVDRGLFILAGSAQPSDDITRHTGAGRMRRIRMRPMSLFESGDSAGEVSLSGLFEGRSFSTARSEAALGDVVALLCRGGWPGQLGLPLLEVQQNLRDYLVEITRVDIGRLHGNAAHDPFGVEKLLRSVARNSASMVRNATLAADVEPGSLHRHTVRSYLHALRRLFIVEEQPAWPVSLRSRAPLRKSSKLHFVDPSLAVAALGAGPDRLMSDTSTLGLLFESLVVRDLRILSQPLGGRVFHLRDATGFKVDAIVECPDGRWMAIEVKLGGAEAVDTAAASLLRLRHKTTAARFDQLAALVVVTAVGYGYTRPDGVKVTPVTALGP